MTDPHRTDEGFQCIHGQQCFQRMPSDTLCATSPGSCLKESSSPCLPRHPVYFWIESFLSKHLLHWHKSVKSEKLFQGMKHTDAVCETCVSVALALINHPLLMYFLLNAKVSGSHIAGRLKTLCIRWSFSGEAGWLCCFLHLGSLAQCWDMHVVLFFLKAQGIATQTEIFESLSHPPSLVWPASQWGEGKNQFKAT